MIFKLAKAMLIEICIDILYKPNEINDPISHGKYILAYPTIRLVNIMKDSAFHDFIRKIPIISYFYSHLNK